MKRIVIIFAILLFVMFALGGVTLLAQSDYPDVIVSPIFADPDYINLSATEIQPIESNVWLQTNGITWTIYLDHHSLEGQIGNVTFIQMQKRIVSPTTNYLDTLYILIEPGNQISATYEIPAQYMDGVELKPRSIYIDLID